MSIETLDFPCIASFTLEDARIISHLIKSIAKKYLID